jgi:GDP/UDP-N,N'-diacetylbacillosamine 2-epimerase (hydrolysing)
MKIGVLTSSRADYGIYLPLLQRIKDDQQHDLEIIAFGTHLSRFHGYTIDIIKKDGYAKIHELASLLTNDNECAIATAYGLTGIKFAEFWQNNSYDWVFCLGDRFEMSAAVQAALPFGVRFAHLHGGETTLGAIDNVYRHQITLAATLHFPATSFFAKRITEIIGTPENIYPVGSLSIDALSEMAIPEETAFREEYGIEKDFVLLTFHPETVDPQRNEQYAKEMFDALSTISQTMLLVITMPNADTNGSIFRKALFSLKEAHPEQVILIENLGKLNYFAAMRYCRMLIGNTSSGIIEAASFGKYVLNVGDRQKGRAQSANVVNTAFEASAIVEGYAQLSTLDNYTGENIYHKAGTVDLILNHLKNAHEKL